MTGVLVDEQSFPFDSPILSPLLDNVTVSRQESGELDRVSGQRPLEMFPSDFGTDNYMLSCFTSNTNPINVCNFPLFDLCNACPSSSPERGSPIALHVDGRDELRTKAFSRCLSKFGAGSLVTVNEDEGQLSGLEGLGSEYGGAGDSSFSLSGGELKDFIDGGTPLSVGSAAYDGFGSFVGSPDMVSALQKFLPSNDEDGDVWPAMDAYSCDEFRMYEFKVRRCTRGRSHDWTECPFAHPGEKARRRDPRRFHYSGTACPDFRKGSCRRGDACEFAHGVFECWLHPARYRTQPCKDGRNCKRRVCFFAHTPEQLRLVPGGVAAAQAAANKGSNLLYSSGSKASSSSSLSGSYDGSPLRQALAGSLDGAFSMDNWSGLARNGFDTSSFEGHVGSPRANYPAFINKLGCVSSSQISSPTSTLMGHSHSPPPLSPPLSPPPGSPPVSPDSSNSWSQPTLVCSLSGFHPQSARQSLSPFLQSSIASPSSVPASPMSTHGPSPLSSVVPAHRRHLDRLQTLPSISLPNLEGMEGFHINSPGLAPMDKMNSSHSPRTVNELITSLQHLELRARAAEANRMSPNASAFKSSSFQLSQSLPGTPRKVRWTGQVAPWENYDVEPILQRVESGRDLRAKIYGRLCKELPTEESPDLGWVNELVK